MTVEYELADLLQDHVTTLQKLLEKHTDLLQKENRALRETVTYLCNRYAEVEQTLTELRERIDSHSNDHKMEEERLKAVSLLSENAQKMTQNNTEIIGSMVVSTEKALKIAEEAFTRVVGIQRSMSRVRL